MSSGQTPWDAIFGAVASGDSISAVCKRFGINRTTYYRQRSKRQGSKPEATPATPKGAPPATGATPSRNRQQARKGSGKGKVIPMHGGAYEDKAARDRRRADEVRAERIAARERAQAHRAQLKAQQAAAALNDAGVDRDKLRSTLRLASDNLHTALSENDPRAAKEYAGVLTSLSEKLGAVLATEDTLNPAPEEGADLDLSTAEGRQALADRLNQSPVVLSWCDLDVLETARELCIARLAKEA